MHWGTFSSPTSRSSIPGTAPPRVARRALPPDRSNIPAIGETSQSGAEPCRLARGCGRRDPALQRFPPPDEKTRVFGRRLIRREPLVAAGDKEVGASHRLPRAPSAAFDREPARTRPRPLSRLTQLIGSTTQQAGGPRWMGSRERSARERFSASRSMHLPARRGGSMFRRAPVALTSRQQRRIQARCRRRLRLNPTLCGGRKAARELSPAGFDARSLVSVISIAPECEPSAIEPNLGVCRVWSVEAATQNSLRAPPGVKAAASRGAMACCGSARSICSARASGCGPVPSS